MKNFNLSDWALNHKSFIWFLMLISLVAGGLSYANIGREEDPNFEIKTMVIGASMPGASVEEMLNQVTNKIEKKLEELDNLKNTRSVTRAGNVTVFVDLLDTTKDQKLLNTWQRVRSMMSDIRPTMPTEFRGFQFNDNFGDVFGNIYAFTADGYTSREINDYIKTIKRDIQSIEQAGKVEIFSAPKERIYLEFSTQKLAALGIDQNLVLNTLKAQNAIIPSGSINTDLEQVMVKVDGQFENTSSLENINLRVNGEFFKLTDVAKIKRAYVDPQTEMFKFNGQTAIGLAVGMKKSANIIDFGKALNVTIEKARLKLPIGIEIHQVADQPTVVNSAVNHFIQALVEAILIVLAVSFISLGIRAGLVVTLTIPLVLAITFVIMEYAGITLQRISLGALIISLGLLVDDAMIAIETMISRLEKGESLKKSASYAWTSIAFPMLTGTLVTVAGFIPIGLNSSAAGEFTFSLFVVIAVSLLVSWVVAVLFAPLLGVTFLPKSMKHEKDKPSRFKKAFNKILLTSMRFKWVTLLVTALVFFGSVYSMRFVEQQFFPNSDRPELILDITLPQNANIKNTEKQIERLEKILEKNSNVLFWSSYIGRSAPRFLLSYNVLTPGANIGQIVIQTPNVEARDALKLQMEEISKSDFPGVDVFVKLLEIGPPVGRPVQYRISGHDIPKLRDYARDVASLISKDDRLTSIVLDWNEPSRIIRVNILQDKARLLGISSTDIASALNTIYAGTPVTQLRDGAYLIDIVARGDVQTRTSVEALGDLQLGASGIPLRSIANFRHDTEQPVIYQRNRIPTISIKAAILNGDQPATIINEHAAEILKFNSMLPEGYDVVVGGTVESSQESQAPIAAVVPLMVLIMISLTMMQMQGFRLTFIVILVAPLGLIGVVAALIPSGAPLGFVAILGILSLIGILIRNSIILVCEIEALRKKDRSAWDSVVEATESRSRPILLTAAAASLALIPISQQIFWGPMAYAMMGGIIVGTIITLVFVPALYVTVFKVKS